MANGKTYGNLTETNRDGNDGSYERIGTAQCSATNKKTGETRAYNMAYGYDADGYMPVIVFLDNEKAVTFPWFDLIKLAIETRTCLEAEDTQAPHSAKEVQ